MIELGMAYALNKKIVLITKKWTAIKETVRGVTDVVVEYDQWRDIIKPLAAWLNK
jgi:hypothetical protein